MSRALFIAIVFLFSANLYAEDNDMAAYEKCVADLETSYVWYRRVVPPELWSMDRKLIHMSVAVNVMRENIALLKQPNTSAHLISNGVEGCRDFTRIFSAQARRFFALLICLAALVAVLTVKVMFTIFSPRPRVQGAPSNEKPQDQPLVSTNSSSDTTRSRR